jgi:hypothetical protein
MRCAVLGMTLRKHIKRVDEGKPPAPPTLLVEYATMEGIFRDWICLEHPEGTYPHDKARTWHKRQLPDIEPPSTIDAALKVDYPMPDFVTVRKEGKFWKILKVEFNVDNSNDCPF